MKSKESKNQDLKRLIIPILGKINTIAMYLCRDKDKAEDLVADTFLKICENIDKLRDRAKFSSWAFRILNNTFKDNYRASKRLKTVQLEEIELNNFSSRNAGNIETLGLWGPNPEEFLINKLLDEGIRRNINSLPEEFRMTVILCDIENLSYKEISEITRVPAGTVRSRLARGRAILQKKLHQTALEMGIKRKSKAGKEEICKCN